MAATGFYDAAQAALSCVCAQMDATTEEGYPGCPECRVYVAHGIPALDDCCDWRCDGKSHGQLTVHIEDVFPSDNFPTRSAFIHPCAPALWVAALAVTVARCVPSLQDDASPPQVSAIEDSSRVLAIDLQATLVALTCCLTKEPVPGRRKRRVQIQRVEPVVGGGCGAYVVHAFVEAGMVCGCEPVES